MRGGFIPAGNPGGADFRGVPAAIFLSILFPMAEAMGYGSFELSISF
jgi:hypothetical protein